MDRPTGNPGWGSHRPTGPVPDRGQRVGARAIDLGIGLGLALLILFAFGRSERPVTSIVLVWLALTAYETVTTATLGATLGKKALGLRVVALDVEGQVPLAAALRRGATGAALACVPIIGWASWFSSTLTDALTRNIADRASDTMVVRSDATLPIRFRDLPGYADFQRPPRVTPLGRIGDLDVRLRARFRRLNDSPVLGWTLGILALALSLPFSNLAITLVGLAIWVLAFTIDETVRLSRDGVTAGHRLAGLRVVSMRTGLPPTKGRSFLRALVLGLSAYTVIGLPFLAISALMIRAGQNGRGLHDLAGGTCVIADPALAPEEQRLRAMRMRLGEVT